MFLVLLVGVSVALGVVVAGITRASTLTPEERAQLELGNADIRVFVNGDEGVTSWVHDNVTELDPDAVFIDYRQTRGQLEGTRSATVSDIDPGHPLTEGMIVLLDGERPVSPGEAAISPQVAENTGLGIGDRVGLESPEVGELEVVGLVSEPIANSSETILLWPGALVGELEANQILVGSHDAERVTERLTRMWQEQGRQMFWPEPAVDPRPPELETLDEEIYVFLSETEIERLVELAESNPDAIHERAFEMVFQSRSPEPASIHAETRSQIMSQGGLEGNPAVVSTAASALLLIEVAFVTGAAFAAGTRRRLREIGLLSAGGATQRQVRTTVMGEGLTIGLIGSGIGVVLGILILLVGRPVLHRFVSKLITGLGVGFTDLAGPILVALASVLIAVWVPARTASRIPTTTALQGRMPASPPRRWVVPAGVAAAAVGILLITVSIASTSNFSGALTGVGGVVVVGGVAMLASPILAGVSKLADHVPAVGRLVLRDSGRHRTRSAVAVAAIMVILLAPAIFATMAETSRNQDLLHGLPEPENHLLVSATYADGFPAPIDREDVERVSEAVPYRDLAVFDVLEVRTRTREQAAIEAMEGQRRATIRFGQWDSGAAVADDDLLAALGDPRIDQAIAAGRIVLLGLEEQETTVSVDFEELPALELDVPVVHSEMPRILLPPSMTAQYDGVESRLVALFVLDRPMDEEERAELSAMYLQWTGGSGNMDAATVYTIAGGVTLLAVLIVIALVTAVSAAEVDSDLRTIVAVGSPGSLRRRFLGLLTGYQTLIAALLAVPLGLGLMKAFTTAQQAFYQGPFGELSSSTLFIPWELLAALVVFTPVVVGLLTWVSVRSAPVTPPRRVT